MPISIPAVDGWIKKMWYVHTMNYYSAIKKNEIMLFANKWKELEIIMLIRRPKVAHMFSLICGS
jgi:hypothetical protein